MHVLIVSCVYPPEPVTSAVTSEQLAIELVESGHDVNVITSFPNRPEGKLYPGYRRALRKEEMTKAGYKLIRTFSFLSPTPTTMGRFLENLSFGISSLLITLFLKSDVVYANTWPILAIGMLYGVTRLRGIPLIISIQDVYPESLISQKRIQDSSWVVHIMRWIDGFITRGCQGIVVISEQFSTIYRDHRGVFSDRVHVVPNWVDEGIIGFSGSQGAYRNEQGIPQDAFVAAYGGNIGVAGGVENVIESVKYLKELQSFYLIIAGQGSNLIACQNLAKNISCPRILFHSPWPREETATVLSAADVLILPTRGNQSLASMPSKLISYMLAARPVIVLATPNTDLAKVVEQSGCGWIIKPDQPKLLADTIEEVMSIDSIELVRRGQAGRKFAQERFSRQKCLPRVIDILEQAVTSPSE